MEFIADGDLEFNVAQFFKVLIIHFSMFLMLGQMTGLVLLTCYKKEYVNNLSLGLDMRDAFVRIQMMQYMVFIIPFAIFVYDKATGADLNLEPTLIGAAVFFAV